ncbi:MAG: YlbF family regulator [Eubacteriaceae bacterium]|nr:YlbF family regulator [Eubacteriaceae bacterium]
MNIYDALNSLTSAIKDSEEYRRFTQSAKAVDSNPALKEMMTEFFALQVQLSTIQMMGQQPDEEQINHFNAVYASLSGYPAATEFIQSQMYFSRIMEDVYKELAKVADVGCDFMKLVPDFE